jgi:hypothetical protein
MARDDRDPRQTALSAFDHGGRVLADGGHDETFDPDAETVSDAWEGAFINTSWGYDQTNVEMAQIVEVSDSGKTVLARLVRPERVETDRGSESLRPSADQYGDEFRLQVRASRGDPIFRGSYPYISGDPDDGQRLDTFVPFDNASENTVHQTPTNYGH